MTAPVFGNCGQVVQINDLRAARMVKRLFGSSPDLAARVIEAATADLQRLPKPLAMEKNDGA